MLYSQYARSITEQKTPQRPIIAQVHASPAWKYIGALYDKTIDSFLSVFSQLLV